MRFLFYSQYGESAQVAHKIAMEGNEVGLYINKEGFEQVFDGLIDKVTAPDSFIDSKTITIFDASGLGRIADAYRKAGHKVYGASFFADKLERDRQFGFECMRNAKIKIPDYKEFTNWVEAEKYIMQNIDKRFVFKPSGDMPTKLTYVPDNNEELIEYLKYVKKKFGSKIKSFILQEYIKGLVISSEFFCDGKKFIRPGNNTIEDKKFMNDGLGLSTGCSGNVTWADDNWIIEEGIARAEEMCVREGFVGQIDLNAVIEEDTDTVYGLEWTPRFGYDATPTFLTLIKGELGKFFSDLVDGSLKDLKVSEELATAVRLTIPPYPIEGSGGKSDGVPILGWHDFQEDIYFYEVMMTEDGLVHSGSSGVILLGLGKSDGLDAAMLQSYDIVETVTVPDKQYRTDLIEVFTDQLEVFYGRIGRGHSERRTASRI